MLPVLVLGLIVGYFVCGLLIGSAAYIFDQLPPLGIFTYQTRAIVSEIIWCWPAYLVSWVVLRVVDGVVYCFTGYWTFLNYLKAQYTLRKY